jgi:hypothetical protein
MDYSVAIRRKFSDSLKLSFIHVDKNLPYNCYEYFYMDRTGTLNDTLQLNCIVSNTNNEIYLKKNFNGLLSIGLQERRLSGHHLRFIDYSDCRILFHRIY